MLNFKPNQMKPYYLLLLLLPLLSCKKEGLANYQTSFENNRWYKTKPVTLHVHNEIPHKINLTFEMGYVYGSQFAKIPLEVYITNPLHQIDKIPVTLTLFDANKNELGECAGDYCDIKQVFLKDYTFNEIGAYKIQILNTFPHQFLPNVNSIKVNIKKAL